MPLLETAAVVMAISFCIILMLWTMDEILSRFIIRSLVRRADVYPDLAFGSAGVIWVLSSALVSCLWLFRSDMVVFQRLVFLMVVMVAIHVWATLLITVLDSGGPDEGPDEDPDEDPDEGPDEPFIGDVVLALWHGGVPRCLKWWWRAP